MKLVLVADPMCSWCYGFAKEMTSLQARHPEMSLDIVVGGLRAGATDILDEAGKRLRLEHWARVEQASGLPFDREGLLARKDFVSEHDRCHRNRIRQGEIDRRDQLPDPVP